MESSPKKGWVSMAINKHIAMILRALIDEKLEGRGRLPSRVVSDLNVMRVMLDQSLMIELDIREDG